MENSVLVVPGTKNQAAAKLRHWSSGLQKKRDLNAGPTKRMRARVTFGVFSELLKIFRVLTTLVHTHTVADPAMSQMCTDYPVPVCDRLTPVPAADLTLINLKHGKDYLTLCKNEQGRSKTADVLNPWSTYQIISKPIALKSNDSTFPASEDFLLARTAIKEGGVVPATVQALDLKILDNHAGYSKFSTGQAYYFQKNLQRNAPNSFSNF